MSARAEFSIDGSDPLAEPYHYEASGLDNIYLLNGVCEHDTPYGAMIHIEHINGLHRAIGLHIAEKSEPMTGAEFRFLRKQLGSTQAEIAEMMIVTDQTIANYEKGVTKLASADPLMRAYYLVHILPDVMHLGILRAVLVPPSALTRRLPEIARLKVAEGWREGRVRARAA